MKKYVDLQMPSVLGMGAIGPTLSVLTATFCSAFRPIVGDHAAIYPCVMLFLSSLLAIFPTIKAEYSAGLKVALYPIAVLVIFVSAWGVNTGLSAGESTITESDLSLLPTISLVPSAYAGDSSTVTVSTNTIIVSGITATNSEVDLTKIDYKTPVVVPIDLVLVVPKGVWCFEIAQYRTIYLKNTNSNVWVGFRLKQEGSKEVPKEQKPYKLKGGFFRRF